MILNPFPRFGAFTNYTPTIPSLYWDTYSQEERIKALCKEYAKLVAYTDSMAETVNSQYDIIEALKENFPELVEEAMLPALEKWAEDGSLRQYIDEQLALVRAEIGTAFTGCTPTQAGLAGAVPAPKAGDQDKFLCAAGTWETVSGGGGGGAGVDVSVNGNTIKTAAGNIDLVEGQGVMLTGSSAGGTARVTIDVDETSLGLATVATTGSYNDLTDRPTIPAAQVQSDWTESNPASPSFIKNKPETPAAQVQADWTETRSTELSYIKNKPAIDATPTRGSNALITSGGVFNSVNDLSTRVARLSIDANTRVICIGDSFLDGWAPEGTHNSWGTIIGQATGATVHNYSEGGAGFYQTGQQGHDFAALVDNAYTELNDAVDFVIIGGGYNDQIAEVGRNNNMPDNYDPAIIGAKVTALVNKIRGYWPDAEVYIFPMLWGSGNDATKKNNYGYVDEDAAQAVKNYAAQANGKPCNVVMGCWTWIYGHTSDGLVSSDNVHPLEPGQKVIAKSMLSAIAGVDPTVMVQSTEVSSGNQAWRFIRTYMQTIVFFSNVTANQVLPNWCMSDGTFNMAGSGSGAASMWGWANASAEIYKFAGANNAYGSISSRLRTRRYSDL